MEHIAFLPVHRVQENSLYNEFLAALAAQGFQGDIERDLAKRVVFATDNSVYQRLPQACVFPRHTEDLICISRLAGSDKYRSIVLTARGGGTGTNGQSLTDGIIVDMSRHMNHILHIDARARTAVVQPGVVKDQLNAALKPYGLFFAPELSTSNRATIGGMINTDASGQGSCTYGKTRDHVLGLKTVLLGGQVLDTHPLSIDELPAFKADPLVGPLYQTIDELVTTHAQAIQDTFPPLNRCLTGYDLPHIKEGDSFNLNNLLCGAEGSLGFIAEAKLNVLPIPTEQILVNVRYADFEAALRDAKALMTLKPLSIETVDSKVLGLAQNDIIWHSVADYFPDNADGTPTLGINLIEFAGNDIDALQHTVAAFIKHLDNDTSVVRLGHTIAHGAQAVNTVYGMRKRSVGLLGNVDGEVRPQPFVEDTAVPPENLADFIAEFRSVLDEANLSYGMFGHVDAGVLHVRPALDMKDPAQAAMIRPITDKVVELVHKYGGVLWGEHGKGLRSGYAPKFFGDLYPVLQQIKALFDPYNQLNPGKIATPSTTPNAQLLAVDQVDFRGDFDRQIRFSDWKLFNSAVYCNGNGACYNYDTDDAMCPSWKATRDRLHSPKGRASAVREWLRLQNNQGLDLSTYQAPSGVLAHIKQGFHKLQSSLQHPRSKKDDYSHQVYEALEGCLSCKSCAGQCPVKVNVPDFKARFLYLYHSRYVRPLKDYAVGSLEYVLPYAAKVPALYNGLMRLKPVQSLVSKTVGLSDIPLLSATAWQPLLERYGVQVATPEALKALSPAQKQNSLILVQDAFTRYFETPLWEEWLALLQHLQVQVYIVPFMPNGKPLQVHGFLNRFKHQAQRHAQLLNELSAEGVPLVGLDPAMTLVYRQEYRQALEPDMAAPNVLLPQEWLHQWLQHQDLSHVQNDTTLDNTYYLVGHCTEKTTAPKAAALWKDVFALLGLNLVNVASGCCGMAGTYGHETQHQATSATIYGQSWQRIVARHGGSGRLLATGYSCRSQVQRFSQLTIKHPLHVLQQHYYSQARK